jgi:hypothetical protein
MKQIKNHFAQPEKSLFERGRRTVVIKTLRWEASPRSLEEVSR